MAIKVDSHVPIPKEGEKPLTSKEAKFVDAVLNGEKRTLTKTVQEIYAENGSEISYKTASSRVGDMRKLPGVMSVLQAAEEEAQHGIVEIARYSKALGKTGGKEGAAYASVALSAEKEILDRVHGKAKQSVDVTTRSVTINMDLTQDLPEGSTD